MGGSISSIKIGGGGVSFLGLRCGEGFLISRVFRSREGREGSISRVKIFKSSEGLEELYF